MIALGIKVDEKSFQKADAAFGGLTKSALQFGAVLAGKLAIDKVVGDFKNLGTELNNFHKLTGINTQNVQALGQAYSSMGGNVSDAFDDLKKMQDLMASPVTGNVGWMGDAAKFGLDPNEILKAESTADALANIAKQFEHMTPLNQRLAANAIGLSEAGTRLAMQGEAAVRKQYDMSGKIGIMTGKQVEDAARLTKANSELNLVFADMGNTIAGELTPALSEMAEEFVSFYHDNKDLVDSGLKEFFGGVADNIELVSAALALMGGVSALKGLAALKALIGLGKNAVPPAPSVPGPAATAVTKGIPLLARVGVPLAAALYSSKLNEGEDQELLKNRMKQGGAQAAGPVIDYLRSKGISEVLATGIAARIQKESQFNAKAVGDGGQAYGLLQWHPDRQAEFSKYLGKDIKRSTETEQMDFIVHEITKGKEKSNWEKVKGSQTPYEAGSAFSRYVVRPGITEEAKEREARETGELAESYGRSAAPASTAPEVTQEQLDNILGRASISDHAKAWLESYRKPPREHTANSVVQPTAQESASLPGNGSTAAQPSYIDRRTYNINGADIGKVRQILNESMSQMTEQTMQDFKSPEK